MPQLDFISFFSQLFWLAFFFFIFYSFTFICTVPFLSKQLKTRFKKLSLQQTFLSVYNQKGAHFNSALLFNFIKFFDFFFIKSASYTDQIVFWVSSNSVVLTIKKKFYTHFVNYIKLV